MRNLETHAKEVEEALRCERHQVRRFKFDNIINGSQPIHLFEEDENFTTEAAILPYARYVPVEEKAAERIPVKKKKFCRVIQDQVVWRSPRPDPVLEEMEEEETSTLKMY
jgi:hypothetical protein